MDKDVVARRAARPGEWISRANPLDKEPPARLSRRLARGSRQLGGITRST
jgi:hypothetical protein